MMDHDRHMCGKAQQPSERGSIDAGRALLAAIVENSNDAIIGRALDGTIVSWNAAAERILGYRAAEVLGVDLMAIFPPEERQRAAGNRERSRAGLSVPTFEAIRITKDGRCIDCSISVSPIMVGASVLGTATFLRDITGHKRIERELRHKSDLAQLLEMLARAASEADTPEAAMRACLARICDHGQWALGRLAMYSDAIDAGMFPGRSVWHTAEPSRYQELIRISLEPDAYLTQGTFIRTVLIEKQPLWASPIVPVNPGGRLAAAQKAGLNCVFAFPVVVQDKAAAFLEFFAAETRAVDTLLLENIANIGAQLARLVERDRALTALRDSATQLNNTLIQTVQAIVATVEKRDPFTAGHQHRVSKLATAIAEEMGLPAQRIDGVRFGASILDIGKLSIPIEILNRPRKLTEHELALVRLHTQAGYDIVKDIAFPWPIAEMILQHHERLDGSGYPRGLKGDDILLEARILAVADVVEAMTSHRPYRPGLSLDQALAEISVNRGMLYEPAAIDACVKVFNRRLSRFEGV